MSDHVLCKIMRKVFSFRGVHSKIQIHSDPRGVGVAAIDYCRASMRTIPCAPVASSYAFLCTVNPDVLT